MTSFVKFVATCNKALFNAHVLLSWQCRKFGLKRRKIILDGRKERNEKKIQVENGIADHSWSWTTASWINILFSENRRDDKSLLSQSGVCVCVGYVPNRKWEREDETEYINRQRSLFESSAQRKREENDKLIYFRYYSAAARRNFIFILFTAIFPDFLCTRWGLISCADDCHVDSM